MSHHPFTVKQTLGEPEAAAADITGPSEDVAFVMRHLPDVDDAVEVTADRAARPDVSDLLTWAVEDGLIRMSKVCDTELQEALVKFAGRLAAQPVQGEPARKRVTEAEVAEACKYIEEEDWSFGCAREVLRLVGVELEGGE